MITTSLMIQAAGDAAAIGDFSFLALFLRAGWVVKAVMLILAAASLWSWAIAVDKMITFHLLKKRATSFEDTFWSGRTLEDLAAGLGADVRDPMARVFAAAMREWNDSKNPTGRGGTTILGTQDRIDRVMSLVVNRELAKAERGMSVLATVGSASVFIGLFGTVWGIMNAFLNISAQEDTSLAVVGGPIAEALFATGLGLIAAIPAVIFYNKFSGDLNRYADTLDAFSQDLLVRLSRRASDGPV